MQIKRFLGNIAKAYLAIGALSVSAFAGADEVSYHQPDYSCHQPACCPSSCCDWGCFANNCSEPPACNWGYNPPAYPRCCGGCDGGGFLDNTSFRADFLWWRASEEGLFFGSEEEFSIVGRDHISNRERCKRFDFKFDPGFRIGLSHFCPCDCWDIAFNWTHYHTKAKAEAECVRSNTFEGSGSGAGGGEFCEFSPEWERIDGQTPDFAHATWKLDLDLLDLELGRKFYVSQCFVLRPYLGLRGTRIDQKIDFFNEANSNNPFANVLEPPHNIWHSEGRARNNFLAVGPRLGLDMELHVGCGLALFGQAAGSIVFGKFDRHAKEFYEDDSREGDEGAAVGYDYFRHSSPHRDSRAITDLAVGIKWDHCFDWCNRLHPVSLAFSWEHHAFFDLNNFEFGSHGVGSLFGTPEGRSCSGNRGDLFTQGLTVSLDVGF